MNKIKFYGKQFIQKILIGLAVLFFSPFIVLVFVFGMLWEPKETLRETWDLILAWVKLEHLAWSIDGTCELIIETKNYKIWKITGNEIIKAGHEFKNCLKTEQYFNGFKDYTFYKVRYRAEGKTKFRKCAIGYYHNYYVNNGWYFLGPCNKEVDNGQLHELITLCDDYVIEQAIDDTGLL